MLSSVQLLLIPWAGNLPLYLLLCGCEAGDEEDYDR